MCKLLAAVAPAPAAPAVITTTTTIIEKKIHKSNANIDLVTIFSLFWLNMSLEHLTQWHHVQTFSMILLFINLFFLGCILCMYDYFFLNIFLSFKKDALTLSTERNRNTLEK